MQINNLIKPLDQMTDEELRARLMEIRHNREIVRPSAAKKASAPAKKAAKKVSTKIEDMFASLSEDERIALIKQLGD